MVKIEVKESLGGYVGPQWEIVDALKELRKEFTPLANLYRENPLQIQTKTFSNLDLSKHAANIFSMVSYNINSINNSLSYFYKKQCKEVVTMGLESVSQTIDKAIRSQVEALKEIGYVLHPFTLIEREYVQQLQRSIIDIQYLWETYTEEIENEEPIEFPYKVFSMGFVLSVYIPFTMFVNNLQSTEDYDVKFIAERILEALLVSYSMKKYMD